MVNNETICEVEEETKNKLIISSKFITPSKVEKINRIKINVCDDGFYQIYVNSGRTGDGVKKYGTIRLHKNNLKTLRNWLDEVIKSE